MIWNSLVIALQQLARNKLRTALTSLGVLIGVAAVIAMVNIGRSATEQVNQDLAQIGDNVLFVVPGDPGSHGPPSATRALSLSDVAAIERGVPNVRALSASATRGLIARHGDATLSTSVHGVERAWIEVRDWDLLTGRMFNEGEGVSGAPVCLLGATVAESLFGSADPLEVSVRLGDVPCTVIGTFVPKGENTFGQDQDDFVLMPITTFHRRIAGNRDVSMIFVAAEEGTDTTRMKADLEAVMRERRHVRTGMDDDFVIRDMKEFMDIMGGITSVLTGLLASIAAVALLVGGIGIMNIMTVSVTERTREIGVRLAIGALARDVLLQFLIEAVVLSVVGGVFGIGFGILLSFVASTLLDIVFVIDVPVIGLAFVVSGAIGVVFGYWPARKAARMRPIDALRHE